MTHEILVIIHDDKTIIEKILPVDGEILKNDVLWVSTVLHILLNISIKKCVFEPTMDVTFLP